MMFSTAPTVAMQAALGPPAAPVPAYAPQGAPATARITQMALLGAVANPGVAPEQKPPSPALPGRGSAAVELRAPWSPFAAGWDALSETSEAGSRGAGAPPPPTTSPREAAQKLLGMQQSAFAAQMLGQHPMEGVALPPRADIAELLRRVEMKRSDEALRDAQAGGGGAPAATAQARPGFFPRSAPMLSFAGLIAPNVLASAKAQHSQIHAPLKRDPSMASLTPTRGAGAYQRTAERLGYFSPVEAVE